MEEDTPYLGNRNFRTQRRLEMRVRRHGQWRWTQSFVLSSISDQ